TLHCMRDDETKFSEVCRRAKKLLRVILVGVKKGILHGSDLPTDNECSLPSKYGESLLLECLWYCVSKSWTNPISQSESFTNKKHFVNNLLGMEPLAFPHSLCIRTLQKAPTSFIRFKALEILIRLSKRNMLFYDIIENDFENRRQFSDLDSVKLHQMIETIREKSFQDEKLVDTNKNIVDDLKEKGKVNPANSYNFISKIVATELTCLITCKISKNFQILLCCNHLISSETLQQIINQPTCPFCRKIINLNSVINLPQSAIYQGIRNYLPEDNINVTQDYSENISHDSIFLFGALQLMSVEAAFGEFSIEFG
ncbi:20873_t:CDS:2, partial [Gigaspora rosea]